MMADTSPPKRSSYVGPKIRRLRRDLGLTQAQMADELGISASYVALIERNQRPLTTELLLRMAETYKLDFAAFSDEAGEDLATRLEQAFQDPLFEGLELSPADATDAALGHPQLAEALLRAFTAHKDSQRALAEEPRGASGEVSALENVRRFLEMRRNHFPVLDEQSERLAKAADQAGGLPALLYQAHGFTLRELPGDIMMGAVRRLDRHREALVLDERLDTPSRSFQVALQIAYLSLGDSLEAAVREAGMSGQTGDDTAARILRRALANYAAGAILMPYDRFYRAAKALRYDIEALSRRFGTSFEQTAHRLTTLQRRGAAGIPFFFIRVDAAGNVSKRFDGGGFPFARHGGSCPLWSLHEAFQSPRTVQTQIIELPEGDRFFSVARTVHAGGGGFGAAKVTRAIALGCKIEHAGELVYAQGYDLEGPGTPIGTACRLCHRATCEARAEPPIGRQLLSDDYRRLAAPFGFGEG